MPKNGNFMVGYGAPSTTSPLQQFRDDVMKLTLNEIEEALRDIPFSHTDVTIAFHAGQRYKILVYELIRRLEV